MNTSAISELTGLALVLGTITAASIVADLARRQRTWRAHRRYMNRTTPRPSPDREHYIVSIDRGRRVAECSCDAKIRSPKMCTIDEARRALKYGIGIHTTQTAEEASC